MNHIKSITCPQLLFFTCMMLAACFFSPKVTGQAIVPGRRISLGVACFSIITIVVILYGIYLFKVL